MVVIDLTKMAVTNVELLNDYFYIENTTYNVSETFEGEWQNSLWKHVIEDFKQTQFTLNEPTTIILMILYVPIFLTSLVGNILVLLVIVPNQRMWTVTNNFLVNLAVADLLVTVLCMPMTLAGKVYKLWVYGDVMCKMSPYLQGVSVTSSTFTITAMSLDRCLAILYPVKFRNLRTKRNVRTLIAIIWVTSILLMIPLLIVNKTTSQEIFTNFKVTTCAEDWKDVTQRRAYDFSLLFIICLIPAQIVFVSYLLMGKRLWVTDSRLDANNENNKNKDAHNRSSSKGSFNQIRASRRRMAKMCIIVSVIFVVCWLPYYTANIYLDFKKDHYALDIVYWGLLIGHLHCLTNPILYCFMHKTFRYCVKRMLPCWKNALIRTPSGYGTTLMPGKRASNRGSSARSRKSQTKRSLNTNKRHVQLTVTPSDESNRSQERNEQPENGQIVVDYQENENKINPTKVRLIFQRLRRKKLCNQCDADSLKHNIVEIPDAK